MPAEAAFDRFDIQYSGILAKGAAKSYASGDMDAQNLLKVDIKIRQVQDEALKYSKQYKKDLITKGGTWIVGGENKDKKVFKPWFAESSKEQRQTVAEIIARGVKEGKHPGVKERKRGGYPKDSIAAELHDYFNARRSHASMVARTEVKRIQWEGAEARFRAHGIKELRWLAVGDEKTRKLHRDRNGKTYLIDDAPPLGEPNCRCTYIPVIPKPGDMPPVEIPAEPADMPPVTIPSADYKPVDDVIKDVHDVSREYAHARGAATDAVVIKEREVERTLKGYDSAIADYKKVLESDKRAFYENEIILAREAGEAPGRINELLQALAAENKRKEAADIAFNTAEQLYFKAADDLNDANKALDVLEDEYKKKAREKIYIRDAQNIRTRYLMETSEGDLIDLPESEFMKEGVIKVQGNVKEASEFVTRITSEEKINNAFKFFPKAPIEPEIAIKVMNTGRASASVKYGRINMAVGDSTQIYVHELMHHVEYKNREVYESAVNLRWELKASDEADKLSKITGVAGYGDHEIAFRGNYPDPYMGKLYEPEATGGSTEMVTMAAQMLYDDPIALMQNHPGIFKWIVEVLR